MERAARKFAGWVLFIHVMVFALLVATVALASREFYVNARTQAFAQLKIRQEMLAGQAARGIEGFFRDLLEDMALPARASADLPRDAMAKLAWERLSGRVTRLFEVEGGAKVGIDYGDDRTPAQTVLNSARAVIAA